MQYDAEVLAAVTPHPVKYFAADFHPDFLYHLFLLPPTAPFLKDKWGWTDTDRCWWCEKGRQSRDHLFKECRAWEGEIRELWSTVGRISGKRGLEKDRDSPLKSRRGFGFHVRQARARPSNTTVRELLSNSRYTEAVLEFLGKTRVGEVQEGAICK